MFFIYNYFIGKSKNVPHDSDDENEEKQPVIKEKKSKKQNKGGKGMSTYLKLNPLLKLSKHAELLLHFEYFSFFSRQI